MQDSFKVLQNTFPQGVQYSLKVYFELMFSALRKKKPFNCELDMHE